MTVKKPDTLYPSSGARRLWLASAGALTVAAGLASGWWQRQRETPPAAKIGAAADVLRAWVDTLLPADGLAPGAVTLGVVERIIAAADGHTGYRSLLDSGAAWADEQARLRGATGFAALDSGARESLVALAAQSPDGSTARVYFQATLDDTFYHHYADARSWAVVGYGGPPQPAGFVGHGDAPRT